MNGKRLEQSTNKYIDRSKRYASPGQMKGNSADAKMLNNYLNALRNKVYTFEREMILDGSEINF
ncbi:hypothetical protein QWZ08_10975 [Ferruginibacter paludis]|nr:hypothetical protein [Ferruginibacter paludis]MDN3656152.1 hypothetical protein [Ferruginibacter paludis]